MIAGLARANLWEMSAILDWEEIAREDMVGSGPDPIAICARLPSKAFTNIALYIERYRA